MNKRVTRTKTAFGVATCLSLMTMSTVVADPGASDWIMGGQNESNWRNQSHTSISSQNVANLKLKWKFTTGGDISATPAVSNGVVYFPDWAGNFYAVNANTGALVWKKTVASWTGAQQGDYARNNPAIHGNTLILGNQAGNFAFWNGSAFVGDGAKVVAVNSKTGALQWVTQVESFPAAMVTSSPVIHGNVVYVGVASAEEATAAVAGTPCCVSRGSVVALDVNSGAIIWKTYMVPDNGGALGGYSGGGVWDSTPVVDTKRNLLYVGTGNNYSVPLDAELCFAQNPSSQNPADSCTDPHDYFDSVVALDLKTGSIKWAKRALRYDAWNVNCIETITPPNPVPTFGPGPNCPTPIPGPDYDFGGSGPNLLTVNGKDIVGIGEKSGVYWALNPDNGSVIWNTLVGPGSSLGGIEWGTATDGSRIYVPIANANGATYQPPSILSTNGGSWAALDPATGSILWQTPTPGHCLSAIGQPMAGCMALGPASVANGVVFAGSMDTNPNGSTMFALDATNGSILWQFAAGSSVIAGPAIDGDSVYWGSGYGHFGAFLGTPNHTLYAFTVSK